MSEPTPIRYVGEREPDPEDLGSVALHVEFEDGTTEPVRQVVYHSPTGLEYGYAGSGPADTALSILAHFFGADPIALGAKLRAVGHGHDWSQAELRATHYHQDFKFAYVANAHRQEPLVVYWSEVARFTEDQIAKESTG